MFDLAVSATRIRVQEFWPGNGNQLRLQFVPRVWSDAAPQTINVWLEDAAQAWELFDLLKDEKSSLHKCDDEAERRAAAAEQRKAAIAKMEEGQSPAEAYSTEADEEAMPF